MRDHPIGQLAELRARTDVGGLRERGALVGGRRVRAHPCAAGRRLLLLTVLGRVDRGFHRLAWVAEYEGLQVCKHTHGELGLAAAAAHHVVLTLPNGVEGHQQTAHLMEHDILTEPIPIASGPRWGAIDGPGLGVDVDEDAVAEAAARYRADGQYRPWQDDQLAKEER